MDTDEGYDFEAIESDGRPGHLDNRATKLRTHASSTLPAEVLAAAEEAANLAYKITVRAKGYGHLLSAPAVSTVP